MSDTMTDEIRAKIRETKAALSQSGNDVAAAFAQVDALIEDEIQTIEAEVRDGVSPVPVCDFGDIAAGRIDDDMTARIKQRGVVIMRNTFDADRVNGWNDWLMDYVSRNDYFEMQKSKAGMDQYFANLSSSRPQIFGLYWSKPQMEARTSGRAGRRPPVAEPSVAIESENGLEFNPDRECLYADRLRQREPGDATLGLSPHVDGGRWNGGSIPATSRFTGICYPVTSDLMIRLTQLIAPPQRNPSPAVCSMFRTYQGWTALSRQGPGDGTLNLVPIAKAMHGSSCARCRMMWR